MRHGGSEFATGDRTGKALVELRGIARRVDPGTDVRPTMSTRTTGPSAVSSMSQPSCSASGLPRCVGALMKTASSSTSRPSARRTPLTPASPWVMCETGTSSMATPRARRPSRSSPVGVTAPFVKKIVGPNSGSGWRGASPWIRRRAPQAVCLPPRSHDSTGNGGCPCPSPRAGPAGWASRP